MILSSTKSNNNRFLPNCERDQTAAKIESLKFWLSLMAMCPALHRNTELCVRADELPQVPSGFENIPLLIRASRDITTRADQKNVGKMRAFGRLRSSFGRTRKSASYHLATQGRASTYSLNRCLILVENEFARGLCAPWTAIRCNCSSACVRADRTPASSSAIIGRSRIMSASLCLGIS